MIKELSISDAWSILVTLMFCAHGNQSTLKVDPDGVDLYTHFQISILPVGENYFALCFSI